MPLDHYVSQVHLKNFYSPKLGNLMYAIRKSNLNNFTPNSESVCRIENGSTNSYLREDRVIEEFLKEIEPKYNKAITKLETDSIDSDTIFTISGFVAYIITCSPAAMRIHSNVFKGTVEESTRILDSKGTFPPPPPELAGTKITELLNSGELKVEIDHKYPQAMGISQIFSRTNSFGNATWDILVNKDNYSPYFTSDFPVTIEETEDKRILNRIVPLSPNLAIRIRPNISLDRSKEDYSFSKFRYSIHEVSRQEIMEINRRIVRCAEDIVFFRDNHDWVSKFVEKNAKYWIEPKTVRLPQPNGALLWFTQEITKKEHIGLK